MTRDPWYLRRLLAMSPAEIAARLPRTARHRLDDLAWRSMTPLWRYAWQPSPARIAPPPPAAPPYGLRLHLRRPSRHARHVAGPNRSGASFTLAARTLAHA